MATSTLDLVHAPPTVTAGTTATFEGGGSPVTLDGGLSVADVDSGGVLTRATVTIGTGFVTGDVLGFTAETGITGSYNTVDGVLTLSGTAAIGTYQAELDSITFTTTATTDGTRTIDWAVSDGSTSHGTSATETSTVTVEVGPNVTAGLTVNGIEGASTGTVTVATFTDPSIANATAGDFTASINWDDGTTTTGTVVAQNGGGFAVTGAHTYAEEGSHTIGVAVADTNNITGNANDSATVADAALTPVATDVSEGVEGVTPAILSATFRDANPGATASDFGTVAWGDGTTELQQQQRHRHWQLHLGERPQHVYAEEGTDNISVVINDAGGSKTTETGSATVTDAPLLTVAGTTLSSTEGAASRRRLRLSRTPTRMVRSATSRRPSAGATARTRSALSRTRRRLQRSRHLHLCGGRFVHVRCDVISDVGGSTAQGHQHCDDCGQGAR